MCGEAAELVGGEIPDATVTQLPRGMRQPENVRRRKAVNTGLVRPAGEDLVALHGAQIELSDNAIAHAAGGIRDGAPDQVLAGGRREIVQGAKVGHDITLHRAFEAGEQHQPIPHQLRVGGGGLGFPASQLPPGWRRTVKFSATLPTTSMESTGGVEGDEPVVPQIAVRDLQVVKTARGTVTMLV
jgi:hypothetical protein